MSSCSLAHPNLPARATIVSAQGELSAPGFVVMVIDDDLAVRNSLKFSLEVEGFTVRSYATGAELLGAEDLTHCSCFVVDQKMPEMNGLDLIGLLRARHLFAPAILITSHPAPPLRERAREAGVPIVEKPLLGNVLLDKIRDLVGGKPS
jgi:two-component system, LuxR family, response regulator FixJ